MGDVDKIEKYLSRRTDSFGRLNSKIFKAIYAKRNKETIRVPLPNRIPLLIHSYIASTIETSFKVPKIYLNVYPYDLTVNERAVLSNSLKSIYKHKIDIEILYKPEKEKCYWCWRKDTLKKMSDKREAYKVGNSTPSALESALKIKTNGYGSSSSNKIREVGSSDIGKPT
jgi:hypothetical protein